MKITIVSANQMLYISSLFQNVFQSIGITCTVILTSEFNSTYQAAATAVDENHYYLIYCIFTINPLHLQTMASNLIIYNLEQHVNNEISRHYQGMIQDGTFECFYKKSKLNLDYCDQNIQVLLRRANLKADLLSVPVDELSKSLTSLSKPKKIDILFVGILNEKRKTILDFLAKKYKVACITHNVFHKDLIPYFQDAKICLNIHYYENAILERVRINEALHHGLFVVSEKPNEQDEEIMQYYKHLVDFVDNVTEMESRIRYLVANYDTIIKRRRHLLKKHLQVLKQDFVKECQKYFLPLVT